MTLKAPEKIAADANVLLAAVIGRYKSAIDAAQGIIAHRNPGDVPLLALALTLNVPIWTNDKDFETSAPADTATTASPNA